VVAVDWSFNGADVLSLTIAGLALLVAGLSALYARRSMLASERSAAAAESVVAVDRSRRRDELRPHFSTATLVATDRGLPIECIDLTLASRHDVDDLEVTLLRPEDGQGYAAERIMNFRTGVSGTYGEPVPFGPVAAGAVVRLAVVRNSEVAARVPLNCSCTVEGEPFSVLTAVTYEAVPRGHFGA
jgi:hypothetical protein